VWAHPAAIGASAARVDVLAETVRHERQRLESAAVGVDWHSSAASTFIRRAEDTSRLLARDVTRLEDLAQALRGHAAQVERNLEILEAARRRAVAVAEAGADAVKDTAGGVAHAAGDVVGDAAKVADAGGKWIGDHTPW
jgi:ABC-type transporter Mla subunit MlaD